MENIISFLIVYKSYVNIALGIGIFLLFYSLKNKISDFVLNIIGKILFSKKPELNESFKSSLKRPVAMFLIVCGLFIGIYLNYKHKMIVDTFKIITIMIFCSGILNYVSNNISLVFNLKSEDNEINEVAIKFFSNLLKVIIVCIAVVMVISELGYNINGLLTGLGVGGLAISLAAQDTLKNLVSGFVIIFDKPFGAGDFIETKDFKGTVEDITMRSTRIRKLDDSIIVVPNSTLSDSLITNYARLTRKLVEFKIGLVYSTPEEALKNCEKEIYEYLDNHEMVDSSTIRVCFAEYEESAINLQIRCYIDTTELEVYFKFVEELNFEIKRIIEHNNTDFAYPTRSIYLEKN